MTHEYTIPKVTVRSRWTLPIWLLLVGAVLAVLSVRHVWFLVAWHHYQALTAVWLVYFVVTGAQWGMAWFERPFKARPHERARLDRLRVTVSVPVFNEDPEVLDRVLFALFTQTRLPERVEVVDDGSGVDYAEVRDWWFEHRPEVVDFNWVRQANAGKKAAQAHTFARDSADIVVTLDSDTVLEASALDEGLKPFLDPSVQSVAGLELAWNLDRNLLTRLNSTRQLVWQLVTCSAQSVARGSVLINRGTFALYRGDLVRSVLPAYVGETFWGRPIKLGDDTFLTTQALCRGRAVQQPSAVCLTMYPETVSHQLRQWTRWMRGTTLRTFWRIRYLPPWSFGWLYTVVTLWWYFASLAIAGVLLALWPRSASYSQAMLAAVLLWSWAMGTRILVVRRSDQGWRGRLGQAALAPAASLWVLTVLRLARIFGTVTFLRQGWTTRAQVEVWARPPEGRRPEVETAPAVLRRREVALVGGGPRDAWEPELAATVPQGREE
ncbi:MAG: glycosyltransferase [Candidatus Dormibacteria bacterium]